MSSRFIHVVANGNISFSFYGQIIFHHTRARARTHTHTNIMHFSFIHILATICLHFNNNPLNTFDVTSCLVLIYIFLISDTEYLSMYLSDICMSSLQNVYSVPLPIGLFVFVFFFFSYLFVCVNYMFWILTLGK